jgi:hypothetical protein
MSRVIKEWVCLAHGDFEGTKPQCPKGCKGDGMIERVFRTAPAIQSQGFRNINNTFETLARDQGVGNMNNVGGDGMQRADYWTRKKLYDDANSLGYGKKTGQAIDGLFKPIGQMPNLNALGPTGLQKTDGGQNYVPIGRGVAMPTLTPNLQGIRPYDGKSAGLPSGDVAA